MWKHYVWCVISKSKSLEETQASPRLATALSVCVRSPPVSHQPSFSPACLIRLAWLFQTLSTIYHRQPVIQVRPQSPLPGTRKNWGESDTEHGLCDSCFPDMALHIVDHKYWRFLKTFNDFPFLLGCISGRGHVKALVDICANLDKQYCNRFRGALHHWKMGFGISTPLWSVGAAWRKLKKVLKCIFSLLSPPRRS